MNKLPAIKTIDEFILPFVFFFAARYIGLFIATFIDPVTIKLGMLFEITSLPFVSIPNITEQLLANSISWAFTGSILGIIFGFTAFRILHLNDGWMHPKEAAKFHQKGLQHFIIDSNEATHQVTSWSLVTLLALNLAIVDIFVGNLTLTVFGFILAVSALLTVLFLLSWVREANLNRKEIQN